MKNWISIVWKRLVLPGLLGLVWGVGYFVGHFETERLVLAASEVSYTRAKAEAETALQSQFITDLNLAKEEAFTNGKKEGQAELRQQLDDRRQDKADLAYFLGILKDPQIYNKLPMDGQELVDRSAQSVEDAGVLIPGSVLPAEISQVPETACVNPSGLFIVQEDQRFTICGSNEVVIVRQVQISEIDLSVNGLPLDVSFAGRSYFNGACIVAYERRISADEGLQAEIRLGC